MSSITQVAKRAKVSVSTVSRILNGGRNVAPATARAVEEAIDTLEYTPQSVRPGPKTKKRKGIHSGLIAFFSVAPYSPEELYRLPAMPKLLGGIHQGLDQHGLELVKAHSPKGKFVPPFLSRNQVDGVLLFGDHSLAPALSNALHKIPVVNCWRCDSELRLEFDQVFYDNSIVGALAAEYLLERGHKNLAFISLRPAHPAFKERQEVFVETVRKHGGTVEVLVGEDPLLGEPEARLVRAQVERLARIEPRPTGVFCAVDDIMLTTFDWLIHLGIEPEKDIELIGCNNDPVFMRQMSPTPATIDVKLDGIGEQAVEQLLWRMGHSKNTNCIKSLMYPELVPREGKNVEVQGINLETKPGKSKHRTGVL